MHVNSKHYQNFEPFISNWTSQLKSNTIIFETAYMNHAPDFNELNTNYSINSYEQWLKDLGTIQFNKETDIIISDNSPGPLVNFGHTILIGSFLWLGIKKLKQNNWKDILETEEKILKKYHPIMLGIKAIAMSQVFEFTNFTGFPWLCERDYKIINETSKDNILITAGGTANSYEVIPDIIYQLRKVTSNVIYADNGLARYLDGFHIKLPIFDFSINSFLKLKCMIARPGIGSITECIKYGIPLISIGEESQDELANNAMVMEKKKMGLNLIGKSLEEQSQLFYECFNNKKLMDTWRNNLLKEPVNGSYQLANHILMIK